MQLNFYDVLVGVTVAQGFIYAPTYFRVNMFAYVKDIYSVALVQR